MKKLLIFAFMLACITPARRGRAATYDINDPEICSKVAAGIRTGDEAAITIAPQLQDEGICSARQLGL